MRRKTLIFLLLFVIIFVMAEVPRLAAPGTSDRAETADTTKSIQQQEVMDSLKKRDVPSRLDSIDSIGGMERIDTIERMKNDTAAMDSLRKAIWLHNKVIDDSLRADSLNRQRKNGIDAPVEYTAEDSMVYEGDTKLAYLFGKSHVKYENMDLESDQIYMSMDSSLVHAMGSVDSTGRKIGLPVFKMGNDTYETDTMAFNFKTKKGLISNVYTQQDDGYMTSEKSKRGANGDMFLYHGRYTTCDLDHPDFYFAMSRAKVRPGKDVVFGPTYLVVADVPLPFAIPYGFFPFTKSYSSGFIMPTYGDETSRGFYLRDGGYYFAISDKMDLKLTGEIYTKGSWGLKAMSNYKKRYKYSGSFNFTYQNSVTGDKNMPDYSKTTSFQLQWSHRQDPKANPFNTLTASVNYSSTSFEQNNLSSLYNPQSLTQSTRTSSVAWGVTFSNLGLNVTTNVSVDQNMRDSTLTLKLPDVTFSLSRFYPFKRKKMVGDERWYEKISVDYTGHLTNLANNMKEDKLMHSSLAKDWKNGFEHRIRMQGSFNAFGYVNVTPSFNFTDRMYLQKQNRSWDADQQKEVVDTLQGFYNVYNWDMALSTSTTLYGFYVPSRKLFGDKIQAIRHVFKPSISFSYHPDFSSSRYGFYGTYDKVDANGNVTQVEYDHYNGMTLGSSGKGMAGSVTFDLSNNLEMKIKSDDDSTGYKKISLIDELGAQISYNFAAEEKPWSDLTVPIRLKLSKSYTFSLTARFATYAYEADSVGATPYIGNHTEWSKGRFGRFQGMSQNFNLNLDNKKVADFFKWLRGEKRDKDKDKDKKEEDDEYDTGLNTNIDDKMEAATHQRGGDSKGDKADVDEDGYMLFNMPWRFNISYGVNMTENTGGQFNYDTMRYPYKFTQNLNFGGNIQLAEGWNIDVRSGYDFEAKKISMTTVGLSRDLHCFNMSCQITLAPYTSYNFSFRCNAATLTDALKYDKRSSFSNAVQWY